MKKIGYALILFCAIKCTSSIESLKNENPDLFKKIITEWIVIKNEKELTETGNIRFKESGLIETALPICGKDQSEGQFIKPTQIEWRPAHDKNEKFREDAVWIVCHYIGTFVRSRTEEYKSTAVKNRLLIYETPTGSKIANIKRASLRHEYSKDDEEDYFFYILKGSHSAVESLESVKNTEEKENKSYYEDAQKLDSLTPDLTKFAAAPNDTKLQESQKKEAKIAFLNDFNEKLKGKKIKFNHAFTESVDEQKEYNAKGKKYEKKIAALGLGVFVKDSSEQIMFRNLVGELSQCNDCHSEKIQYKAVFRLKMIHPESQKRWNDLKIVRIYDDKNAAASLRKDEPLVLKGKIKKISIEEKWKQGTFLGNEIDEIEIE